MVIVNMDIMKLRNRKNSFIFFSFKLYYKLNRYKKNYVCKE